MSQCKKLIRCMETAEEHGSQCVNHKPAHVPKRQCEVILKGTHQCSNQARKGETKCSVHGPKVVRQILSAYVFVSLGRPANGIPLLYEGIEKSLKAYWREYVDDSKYPIHPITEWIEYDWQGQPYLVVVLPKDDAHDITFPHKMGILGHEDDDKLWMDIEQQPQKA